MLQVNVCKRHNILVSKGLEYSLVISIFCSIEHLEISSGTISQIFFQQRKYMNRFKNLSIIINFIWFRSFLLLVVSFREENLSLFGSYKYMNCLIWTKIKNLKCYCKYARDGNRFRKRSEVVEPCRPVSGNVVFLIGLFWI